MLQAFIEKMLSFSFLALLPMVVRTDSTTVQLSYGIFQGTATGDLVTFLGMPFAAPPVGNLRFTPPQPPLSFSGVHQASGFGASCPQQTGPPLVIAGINVSSLLPSSPQSEDCLFINVVKPANIPAGVKLPVLFWIFGGAFEIGDDIGTPGNPLVERSIALGEPVIYVSANYRINAFGFLGGQEVKNAGLGNIGLRDQRFAMQWVHDNIGVFGGDPDKVTIWGGSAGAISVGLHMIINNADPQGLFRAAFMESGSPTSVPVKDITFQQPFFDQIVAATGCSGASDKIACLRGVPFSTLMTAINNTPNVFSYSSINLAWRPTVDGVVITEDPQVSIQQGRYAKIPFISGNVDDEGTVFSLTTLNITNNAQFLQYVGSNYLPGISPDQLNAVGQAYPDDITQGAPFDTGIFNALTAEYKRLAAFQGDIILQAPRRFFMQYAAKTQQVWAYLYKRGKATPIIGCAHGSDSNELYGAGLLNDNIGVDAVVNFANTMDPNNPKNNNSFLSLITWQPWGSTTSPTNQPVLTFVDLAPFLANSTDNYRVSAMNLLTTLLLQISGLS